MVRRLSHPLWFAGLVAAALLVTPELASAQVRQGTWLASTVGPSGEIILGRLVVRDGSLTFFAPRGDWTTGLADIKRVARQEGSNRGFEVETAGGEVLRLSILGPQMTAESPSKAMQLIQRAVSEAPQSPALAATAPASGGSSMR